MSSFFKDIRKVLQQNVREYGMFIALFVIMAIFSVMTKGIFISSRNISNLVNQTGYIAVLAVGMTLIIVIRHIDLSVGYLAGFLGAVAAIALAFWNMPLIVVIPMVLTLGILGGLITGFPVAQLGIPAFVTSLASWLIYHGFLQLSTAGTGTISAGDTASFTIKVTNLGPGKAYGVVIHDELPAGVNWTINPAVTGCAIEDGTLTCSIDELSANASFSVTVTGATDAADCGTLTNSASASASNEPEGKVGNNGATATITVNCPDLKIEKTAAKETISAGDTASFTIKVTNNGLGKAYDVIVTDDLPAGIAWSITPAVAGCSITDGTLTCTIDELAASGTFTVTISGETEAVDCGTLSNTATVTAGNEAESAGSDNSSTATITVNCPDLTIEKTAVSGTINAGDVASFKIVVTNQGQGTAYDVKIADTLPAGIDWTINPAVTGCAIANGVLTCTIDELAPAPSLTVIVRGETSATECGVLSNTATVEASNEADRPATLHASSMLGDNSSTATITVNCPDSTVSKTADDAVVVAGGKVGFSITVSNLGPGTAYDVTVTDNLPASVSWTIDSGSENCQINGSTLSCTYDALASGASQTIHVSGTTNANSCGLMTNTVNVAASNEAESATGNNRAYANVTVACDNVVVAKYICVTNNPNPSVEFVVTTPRGDDGSRGCAIGAGVHFTITGPSLANPIKVVTGQDGRLSVTLLTGSYKLTEDSTGASVDFSVTTNQPTLINVYNLEPSPTVEVTILKFWCKHVENGVLITVNEAAGLKGCTPGSAIVQLDGGTPFRINDNGTITILVSVGEHTISEPSANASMTFTATAGKPVKIRIYNQIQEPQPGPSFPNTGSGADLGNGSPDMTMALMMLFTAVMLAGLGITLRRRTPGPENER